MPAGRAKRSVREVVAILSHRKNGEGADSVRRFELVEGSSSKFWEVDLHAQTLTVRYGRIGTQGQTQTKALASADKAQASLSEILCVRHNMTMRSMYAEQDEAEERSDCREVGGVAHHPQGTA